MSEGLFVLGVPNRKAPGGFDQWEESLEAAMAKIDEAYIKNFDDRWGWNTFVWLNATEKGKQIGRALYEARGPWP